MALPFRGEKKSLVVGVDHLFQNRFLNPPNPSKPDPSKSRDEGMGTDSKTITSSIDQCPIELQCTCVANPWTM